MSSTTTPSLLPVRSIDTAVEATCHSLRQSTSGVSERWAGHAHPSPGAKVPYWCAAEDEEAKTGKVGTWQALQGGCGSELQGEGAADGQVSGGRVRGGAVSLRYTPQSYRAFLGSFGGRKGRVWQRLHPCKAREARSWALEGS